MYGGGETLDEVAQSVAKATADMAGNMQIEGTWPVSIYKIEVAPDARPLRNCGDSGSHRL
jgi:hypothetical protein